MHVKLLTRERERREKGKRTEPHDSKGRGLSGMKAGQRQKSCGSLSPVDSMISCMRGSLLAFANSGE